MKINKKKTEIMCNEIARKKTRNGIAVDDGERLEEVSECKYLGRLITRGSRMNVEINRRITAEWKSFG